MTLSKNHLWGQHCEQVKPLLIDVHILMGILAVLAAPVLIQLPANVLVKVAEAGLSSGVPAAHVGDQNRTPGSCVSLGQSYLLWPSRE